MQMLQWIDDDQPLPPTGLALGLDSDAPGLLAAGGRLTPQRLEEAYRHGIFPWFSAGQPVLWWSPDPRMVLHAAEFKLSRSLAKTLRRFVRTPGCELRIDGDFRAVIQACAGTPREGQGGTWIVPQMVQAYVACHRRVEDRAGRAGGLLPLARRGADRLPAAHRPPGVAGRARDPAAGLRGAPVPQPGGAGNRRLDL